MKELKSGDSWQCPYCKENQVLQEGKTLHIFYITGNSLKEGGFQKFTESLDNFQKEKGVYLKIFNVSCVNRTCKKLSLSIQIVERIMHTNLHKAHVTQHKINQEINPKQKLPSPSPPYKHILVHKWDLLPESKVKPQPEYIPEKIRKNYEEACKVVNHSPSSASTLGRKCLEGMIEDFCEIKEKNLYAAINKLTSRLKQDKAPQVVTQETIEFMDSLRKMGNIGAHMKLETDRIGEEISIKDAELLIKTIEMLFEDWYISRHEREERLKKMQSHTHKS